MAYLHGRTPVLLHLDLKSPNILVNDRWQVKIAGAVKGGRGGGIDHLQVQSLQPIWGHLGCVLSMPSTGHWLPAAQTLG
jgi:hypothetical protein